MTARKTAIRRSFSLSLLGPLALLLSTATVEAQAFNQCGTVEAGVTCAKLFRSDDQRLWVLDTPLTTFQVGDRLRITGIEDPSCITICQQGNGCIQNSQIGSCTLNAPTFCTGTPNSSGAIARCEASGSLVVADNDLTITAVQLPPGEFAIFITSLSFGPPAIPPGGTNNYGFLCLNGQISRFTTQVGMIDAQGRYSISTAANAGPQRFDLNAFPITPAMLGAVLPGDTWRFQCWHRDNSGAGPGQVFRSGFSEGVSLTFS